MAEIRINIDNVNQQIRQLNTAAGELNWEIQKIRSMKQDISSYWQGSGADAFVKKLDAQCQELMNLYKKITSAADTIEAAADRIMRQEEALQKAAQKLK